jgi:hypothetical protein
MSRTINVLWLLAVCALSIVLMGSVESGRLSGLYFPNVSLPNLTFPNLNRAAGAVANQSNQSGASLAFIKPPHLNQNLIESGQAPFDAPFWLVYLLLVGALLVGYVSLTTARRKKTSVHNLSSMIDELGLEANRFSNPSYKGMRNEAVVKYYAVLSKVCAELGLKELRWETPQEYLARVSEKFGLNVQTAKIFAALFERARYGVDLDQEEILSASRFMREFLDSLIRRKSL